MISTVLVALMLNSASAQVPAYVPRGPVSADECAKIVARLTEEWHGGRGFCAEMSTQAISDDGSIYLNGDEIYSPKWAGDFLNRAAVARARAKTQ